MPRVLRCIDHMHANSDLPVSFTDNQGPFNIALNLVGVETIMLWMYDYPTVVHELMDFCTTVLIDWVKVQKQHAGSRWKLGAFPHFVELPKGYGGVWISDDDSTIMSPGAVPRVRGPLQLARLPGVRRRHAPLLRQRGPPVENFLATDGLDGVNNWCMGDFARSSGPKSRFEGRVVLTSSTTSRRSTSWLFAELIAGLGRKGTDHHRRFPRRAVATGAGGPYRSPRPGRSGLDSYWRRSRAAGHRPRLTAPDASRTH